MLLGNYDFVIVGGGIIGLASAMALGRENPGKTVAVLEKESRVAQHQTGHNSGVIHAGIYYPSGSLKARMCVAGRELLYRYCADHDVAHRRTGKLIVATDTDQLAALFRQLAGFNIAVMLVEHDMTLVMGVSDQLLVLDAGTGQNAINQAEEFRDTAGVTGLVLTKLDGTAKGGIAFALRRELGIPIKLIGVGEGEDDLQPFDGETFVEALLER